MMSRWFLIFLTSLLIVLGARYGTYSPLPTAVFSDCETPVAETKLQGLWELDRIDNYEAFHEALGENSGFLGFIEVLAYPFVLERSQLYRIEQCGSEYSAYGKLFKNMACRNSRNRRTRYSSRNERFYY